MKRNALTLALLCSSLAGIAHAAYTEGDLSTGNFITLEGLINNTNPAWAWQVGAAQDDWDTQKLSWRVTGATAQMDFTGKGQLALLDGYMAHEAPTGSVGMTPVITFDGDGYTATQNASDKYTKDVKLTVKGLTDKDDADSEVDGEMTFQMTQSFVAALVSDVNNRFYQANTSEVPHPSTTNSTPRYDVAFLRAADNVKRSADFATHPSSGMTPLTTVVSPGIETFNNANSNKIIGGYHAYGDNWKVSFPAGSVPEVWSGALSVTVAYR